MALNRVLSSVLRNLSCIDGVECSPDFVFTFGDQKIAEAEAVGDTLLLEVLCHTLDAPALVEEYSCCAASGPLSSGRIRFFFVEAPSPDELSALLEAFRSAVDRVSPGAGPGDTPERDQDV